MGQVTIFEKNNCMYCKRVYEALERIRKRVLDEMKNEGVLNPEINVVRVNCEEDGALAALCIRLTGTFTVPHVFFNTEYVGDASQFICLDTKGKEGCNLLYNKMKSLTMKSSPSPEFPPRPEAAMIKVTEDLAFSSQPTTRQLQALRAFGIESVLNILRIDSPALNKQEGSIIAALGLQYEHKPIPLVTSHNIIEALNILNKMKTPVLIHDDCGQRAGLVALMKVVRDQIRMNKNSDLETLLGNVIDVWGKDLGLNLHVYRKSIAETLQIFLESS